MKKYVVFFMVFFLMHSVSAQQILPDFELNDLQKNITRFDDVKGEKLTVIDFWATWCKPCARAIPKLNGLASKYKDQGVRFLGINVDSPRNDAKVKPFVHTYKIKYPVLRDPNSEYSSEVNITGLPTLLMVDGENKIVYIHQGYRPGDENVIEKEIKKHLHSNEEKE
jgi:thiol-disulfide isomerase/thioredoxin